MEVREVQIQTQTHKDYTPPPQFPPQIQERDQLSGLTFTTLFLFQSSSIPPRIGSSIPTLFIASISFYFFAVAFIPLPILSFFFSSEITMKILPCILYFSKTEYIFLCCCVAPSDTQKTQWNWHTQSSQTYCIWMTDSFLSLTLFLQY